MDNLKDKLVAIEPREVAGSSTSNRYDYQQNYGIYCLLELHSEENDYRILFDYHDDIVVLFPAEDPKDLHFYQIKTNETKNWTIGELLKKPKTKITSLSKLSKLFYDFTKFPEYTQSLNFVSNARFNVNLVSGKGLVSDIIVLSDLEDKELCKIKDALKKELGLSVDQKLLEKSFLKVSFLNIDEHETQILGKLQKFLSERFGQDDLPGQSLLKALKGYVRGKQNNESKCTSFDELCKKKSICYSEFERMLKAAIFKKKFQDIWLEISLHLKGENIHYLKINNYKSKCEDYLVERINPLNEIIQEGREKFNEYLLDESNHYQTLTETINNVKCQFPDISDKIVEIKDEIFLEAIILVEIFNNEKR